MTTWGRFSDVFLSHRMGLSFWHQVKTWRWTLLFRPGGSSNRTTSFLVAFASVSRVRGDRREHHEHHLHLFQKEHQEVPPSGKKTHAANVRAPLTRLCVSGPLHTYRVRPKPRWPSAAAQSTLSWGPRRKKAKTQTGWQLADGRGRRGYISPVWPACAHHAPALTSTDGSVCPLPNLFQLPYRMVFAVASEDSILLYDTQQALPFGLVANIHYHTLSDLTW